MNPYLLRIFYLNVFCVPGYCVFSFYIQRIHIEWFLRRSLFYVIVTRVFLSMHTYILKTNKFEYCDPYRYFIVLVFFCIQNCIVFVGQLELIAMIIYWYYIIYTFMILYFGTCQRPQGVFNQKKQLKNKTLHASIIR